MLGSTSVVNLRSRLRVYVVSCGVLLLTLLTLTVGASPAFAGTPEEINVLPTRDALNRSEATFSNSGKWAALSWDSSTSGHNTGQDTTSGWGPSDAFSTVNGAYWTPSAFSDKSGDAAALTMQTSPGITERYVSLWLDMPSPGTAKSGYQLRWTMTNTSTNAYSLALSKWVGGTQTTLASNASVTVAPGTTMAISDTGGTVTAWQGSAGTLSSVLSAADTTFASGYAGLEASGNGSRSANFKAGSLIGGALGPAPVLDNLERSEVPFAAGGKWSKTSWATTIGGAWGSPYRGFGGTGLSGAYWNPASFSDGGETVLTAATVGTGATPEGQYLALWLDMPNPASERSGYEARFTGTNGTSTAYKVELSKWVAGTRTVFASSSGFSLPVGTTIALTESAGGGIALWTGTSTMTPLLVASDATYSSGYAGLEVNGGAGTMYNFKAGRLNIAQLPETTISAGPKGNVLPNVSFAFTATEGATSYECSLDGAAFSACTSPTAYQGLTEGSHTFKVRASGPTGKDESPAERTFQVLAPAKAATKVALLDSLERQEVPLATGKWTKTSWTAGIGGAWMGGYRGFGSNSGLEGAYWNPASFSDGGESQLIAATVGTGATPEGQYLALWLDMPNPTSERSGYEVRFTGTNGTSTAYKAELSKWVAGTRTVLASSSAFSLPVGTTIVLGETTGGNLVVWTGTSTMTQALAASDATFSSGYAGLEVNGGAGTLYNFRAGRMDLEAPNTTIQSGPSGVVQPENVSFAFTSSETGSTFECSLDGAAYSSCSSPKAYPALASGSSHTFKVRAVDAVGNQDETPAERSFQVVVLPSAITTAATAVKPSEATLHASINPNGAETKYQFEYGTTTSYGSKAPASATSIGAGSTSVEASQPVTGLTPGTTYHFRISATNAAGTSRGEDRTFTTPAPPLATTEAATAISSKAATLNATVNPRGAQTTYQFEYGTTIAYGSIIPASGKVIGSGATVLAVSENLVGLGEGTTYHYRVVAVNEAGTTYGADQTLSTTVVPTTSTESATNVEGTQVELHATVIPNGRETTYKFEYGTTTAYGSSEPAEPEAIGSSTEPSDVEQILEGLTPSTTYHYRVVATSDAGTSVGSDQTFTTGSTSVSEEPDEPWEGTGEGSGGSGGPITSAIKGEHLPPNFFLGIQFGGGNEEDPAERNAISNYGAKMLRYNFGPHTPGEDPDATVKSYEHLFELYAERNITILPDIYGGKPTPAYPQTEQALETWRIMTEKLVAAYGPEGTFWSTHAVPYQPAIWWEVWNEPNRGANNPNIKKVDPEKYGTFLQRESSAISRASHEKARTLLGALLSIPTGEAEAMGGGKEAVMSPTKFLKELHHESSYDAVAVHPYAFRTIGTHQTPTNEAQAINTAKAVEQNIHYVHDALGELPAGSGSAGKELWLTELGWPVAFGDRAHPQVSPQIQATLIIKTFDMIRASANKYHIRNVFYFNDRDIAGHAEWDGGCGLREAQGTEGKWRPATFAYEAEAGKPEWPTEPGAYTEKIAPKSRRAVASGRVNPKDSRTRYLFQFVKSSVWSASKYEHAQAGPEQVAGYEGEVAVSSELSGLTPGTQYHYRIVATNENGQTHIGEDKTFETEPSTQTFETVIHHNGRPGWVTVEGHVLGEDSLNGDYVNINFKKKENGVFVFNEQQSTHASIENNYYKLEKKSIGEGVWKVVVVFPGFGEDLKSESNEQEFTIEAIPTETFLTLDKYSNGTPGTASVSGNVQHNGVGINGTVNVNFQKLVGGTWTTMSTAQRVLSNGHYEVLNWGVGVGQWRVRAVFPNQDEYAESESAYHEFSIQPVPTETFLTVNSVANGTPGTASVSGNVQHNGVGVSGYVNVNFEKWNGSSWQTMSSAQRTLSNGHYEVNGWGVGVGQWRVRAVFPEQGDYGQSESSYHEFSVSPVPTEAFLTVDQVVKGKPGNVSVSGNVLHNGQGVPGYVNVNFEKWNGSAWQTMSTAQPGLSSGHYVVSNWGVGAGSWRVRVVFPEQGEYLGSMSGYHEFTI